jgi:hypothetical protein
MQIIPVICLNKGYRITPNIRSTNENGSVEVTTDSGSRVTVFLLEDSYIDNSKPIEELIKEFIIRYFSNSNENYPKKLQCL